MRDETLHIALDGKRRRLWLRTTRLDLLHALAEVCGDDRAACHWATLGIEASEQCLRLCADSKR